MAHNAIDIVRRAGQDGAFDVLVDHWRVVMNENPNVNESSVDSRIVQVVLATEHALDEALLKTDLVALDTLLAEEVTRTSPTGPLTHRTEWLEQMKSAVRDTGHQKHFSMERTAQHVRLYGETAVLTGIVHVRGAHIGPTGKPDINWYLRVYVRRQGRWQLVAHQATRTASP